MSEFNNKKKRYYRYKNTSLKFLCPLCAAPRAFTHHSRLTPLNYAQIILIASSLVAITYPFMQERSFVLFFITWFAFESVKKIFHRKEVPCPYCGFDMTWYRKDVKVARKIVKDFWAQNNQEANATPTAMANTKAKNQATTSEQISSLTQ